MSTVLPDLQEAGFSGSPGGRHGGGVSSPFSSSPSSSLLPPPTHLPPPILSSLPSLFSELQQISKLLHEEALSLTPIPGGGSVQAVFAQHFWLPLLLSEVSGEFAGRRSELP